VARVVEPQATGLTFATRSPVEATVSRLPFAGTPRATASAWHAAAGDGDNLIRGDARRPLFAEGGHKCEERFRQLCHRVQIVSEVVSVVAHMVSVSAGQAEPTTKWARKGPPVWDR
jgi:hypothetical protein